MSVIHVALLRAVSFRLQRAASEPRALRIDELRDLAGMVDTCIGWVGAEIEIRKSLIGRLGELRTETETLAAKLQALRDALS